MASPPTESAPILFRPGKKRKAYRHRADEGEGIAAQGDDATHAVETPTTSNGGLATKTIGNHDDDDDDGPSVAEALRLRHAKKHRHGGVAFRAGPSSLGESNGNESNPEQGLVLHDGPGPEDSAVIGGITKRFAPQTGLVGELVNRHMEEYVESELARRKRQAAEASAQEQATAATSATTGDSQSGPATTLPGRQVESQRAILGKLMEVDLGEEARARTAKLTERARRRLQGLSAEEEEDSDTRRKKPRLGPDGKPWRSRNRRGSDDIKRDQLVEEFLSENKLGVYDLPPEKPTTTASFGYEGVAADERMAEEFRREFMDVMSRGRRRKTAQPAKPGAKKDEEVLKGPKLGGSRNARAAMRDILLKEQEKNKRR